MSKSLRTAAVIGVAVSVMGCAIHPLPEDVTGVSTYKIVQKIRCEAREGLVKYRDQLELRHKNHPAILKNYNRVLSGGAIAYDFTFNITEMNNLDPTLNLTRVLKNKTFTADTSGNFDRTRENTRTFTISDTFEKLMKIPDERCRDIAVETQNYLYPITGRIGVDEMVRTFVGLAVNEDLTGSSDPSGNNGNNDSDNDGGDTSQSTKAPASLADNLMFTTTLKAAGTPQLTVMPLGTALQITGESLGVTASRTDVHSVIVSLALQSDSGSNTQSTNSSCVRPKTLARPMFINVRDRTNLCDAEAKALHAIDLFILRFQINNVSVAVQAAAQ
jgi:hypothetical protein